ncbi:hypothetical protein BKA82DRAFT_4021027 [Pisolithus tinctorius]|nr:hypothetical protein BKA82DRAFT_4021027 [Pisolithus tinctorius]
MVATGLVSGQANSDGRAISIFAMPHPSDPNTAYKALKGAGCMPFSQSDDGLAVIPSPICLQKGNDLVLEVAQSSARIVTTWQDVSILSALLLASCSNPPNMIIYAYHAMLNALALLITAEIALGNKAVCKGWTNNMSDKITSEWHTSGIEGQSISKSL